METTMFRTLAPTVAMRYTRLRNTLLRCDSGYIIASS